MPALRATSPEIRLSSPENHMACVHQFGSSAPPDVYRRSFLISTRATGFETPLAFPKFDRFQERRCHAMMAIVTGGPIRGRSAFPPDRSFSQTCAALKGGRCASAHLSAPCGLHYMGVVAEARCRLIPPGLVDLVAMACRTSPIDRSPGEWIGSFAVRPRPCCWRQSERGRTFSSTAAFALPLMELLRDRPPAIRP